MHDEFCLPDLGEGLDSAKIYEWCAEEDSEVKVDKTLLIVETTKAMVEIPVPYDGYLSSIKAKPGSLIKTGQPLCEIRAKHIQSTGFDKKPPLMGSARKQQEQNNLSENQKAMFENLTKSQQIVAAATLTELAKIHKKINTTQLIIALTETLKQHKVFNAAYENNQIKYFSDIDIGLAVNNHEGLQIASITKCQNLSKLDIEQKIELIKKNQYSSNKSHRMTLSNIGSTGVGLFANPSIIPPGLATIAIGRVMQQPEFKDGNWQTCNYLPISLSFDHRIITGAQAAYFLKTFITLI